MHHGRHFFNKKAPLKRAGLFMGAELADDVRKEGHKASALYCLCKRALIASIKAGAAARHNLAVRIEEFFDGLRIFVVDADELRTVKIFFHSNGF